MMAETGRSMREKLPGVKAQRRVQWAHTQGKDPGKDGSQQHGDKLRREAT